MPARRAAERWPANRRPGRRREPGDDGPFVGNRQINLPQATGSIFGSPGFHSSANIRAARTEREPEIGQRVFDGNPARWHPAAARFPAALLTPRSTPQTRELRLNPFPDRKRRTHRINHASSPFAAK